MSYRYLFGPVMSRRLGVSLGIDLLIDKICSFNCIYCECGKTTRLTTSRKEYVPTDKVIKELDDFLKDKPEIDFITFSGSGEPTLHSGIGEIINFLKKSYPDYKIALLTNGFLLKDKNLQKELEPLDLIIPSLDAMTDVSFEKINRTEGIVKLADITEGLLELKKNFQGEIWLEIFIVPDINNSDYELSLFKTFLLKLNPDKIQINSLDRPGAETWVKKTTIAELHRVKDFFFPLKAEIVSRVDKTEVKTKSDTDIETVITSLIKRRPCTFNDISAITAIQHEKLDEILNKMIKDNLVEKIEIEGNIFYKIKE